MKGSLAEQRRTAAEQVARAMSALAWARGILTHLSIDNVDLVHAKEADLLWARATALYAGIIRHEELRL